ncbi:MAG: endopeptidase La [Defluviitaleaceae bacterium]|nr:endopeptidase La [Defluviitaleaceae bacterium]
MLLTLINIDLDVLFPGTEVSFEIKGEQNIKIFKIMCENRDSIFASAEEESIGSVYKIGIIAGVKNVDIVSKDNAHVTLYGKERGVIKEVIHKNNSVYVNVSALKDFEIPHTEDKEQILSLIRTSFRNYMRNIQIPKPISQFILKSNDIAAISYHLAAIIETPTVEKQIILEERHPVERIHLCLQSMQKRLEGVLLGQKVALEARKSIEKNNQDYYLREQMQVIKKKLGEDEDQEEDIEQGILALEEKLGENSKVVLKLKREFKKLKRGPANTQDANLTREYLEVVLDLPWGDKSEENFDFKNAEEILEKDHYGLSKVKERILEFLAVRYKSGFKNSPVICLVGPPGVGKTSIARSIAGAIGREYVRISLGGVHDESEIRGHRKTYLGAMPGRIIYALRQVKKDNPLILLDEIDKLGQNSHRGDPASALLEILDREQNKEFRDNYLELGYDISDCLFVCTANSLDNIPYALKDRLDIIQLSTYTFEEKMQIAIKYLIPKQKEKNAAELVIEEDAIEELIKGYTKEAGVRQLERQIEALCRKVVKKEISSNEKVQLIKKDDISKYLGARKFRDKNAISEPEVGVVRGLAYTALGGETLSIEVSKSPGKGRFKLTGNIGKVMNESMSAAYSLVRAKSEELGIDENIYNDTDIHIHIPEGATPKDGPSAGVTMATALASVLTDTPVNNKVAMTGEITLRGKVLPIGGLKEKILAAKSVGIEKVILPVDNEGDLSELEDYIKEGLEFVLAKDISDVFSHALVR